MRVYQQFIDIKKNFDKLAMNQNEYLFAEKWLFTVGDEEKCKQLSTQISESRLIEIKTVTSMIQSMATAVTRLPPYHRNFYASLQVITMSYGANSV
jgi:hypothetical protein